MHRLKLKLIAMNTELKRLEQIAKKEKTFD